MRVTVPSLSMLTHLGGNNYRMVVKFLTAIGDALNSDKIPNSYSQIVNTSSNSFVVKVPISRGNYTIPNVMIKVFSDADGACCYTSTVFTITNTATDEVVIPDAIGVFKSVVGAKSFTHNQSDKFIIITNSDGTISDVTPGMTAGTPNTQEGRSVYYMLDYYPLKVGANGYVNFQNLMLPAKNYTLRKFIISTSAAPNFAAFLNLLDNPWPVQISIDNCYLAEITIRVKESGSVSYTRGIEPDWLEATRRMNFPNMLSIKDTMPYGKWNATTAINTDDANNLAKYYDRGMNVWGLTANGFYTDKNISPTVLSNDALYSQGYGVGMAVGRSKRFICTDEIPENQGADPTIAFRMHHYYRGYMDALRSLHGSGLYVYETGAFGPYGQDRYLRSIDPGLVWGDRTTYEQAFTTHLYKYRFADAWAGDTAFLVDDINYRNMNLGYYMSNDIYYLPYELLSAYERLVRQTTTYQGQNRRRTCILYSWHLIQSLQTDAEGRGNGVEYNRTGEIIPFAGGEIRSRQNLVTPAPWGEYIEFGFYGNLIFDGVAQWNSPGARFGSDVSRLQTWHEMDGMSWKKTGDSSFGTYTPGVNNAPLHDTQNGLHYNMQASAGDASAAGFEKWWELRDRCATLEYRSYTSSIKTFTAVPGTDGLKINGHGTETNEGQYVIHDAATQKAGIAIRGTGPDGDFISYYNGFLSGQEYEDDVTIDSINIGRVYGRRTVVHMI